jgi:hypothetical protein
VVTGVVEDRGPVWRLYAPDWISVFASTRQGDDGVAECLGYFKERFEGRVTDDDWQVARPDQGGWLTFLQVRLPSLKGEFTDEAHVYLRAGEFDGRPYRIVRRGDTEERELQAYGRRRLQAGGAGDAATG